MECLGDERKEDKGRGIVAKAMKKDVGVKAKERYGVTRWTQYQQCTAQAGAVDKDELSQDDICQWGNPERGAH